MKTVNDIRAEFLSYFKGQGHEVVPSSPLVPQNDPTLMFTNSGMVQFKDVFTGKEKRPYTRATTAQKSVRAGGKHNDLENVGYTARHHTFFEMLGNFSFGDYFKDDAIAFAWELVTKNFGLPADKLLVTVHSTDEEAAEIWKKVTGFSDDKIIRIPTSDNFWEMGPIGPCGPCTEIFYDHGDHIPGGPPGSPDEDGDRFIEIWNLVFMQFEQIDENKRIDLPKPSVDTGMGLERIAAILQGVHTNYEIDLFQDLIKHISDVVRKSEEASHRVIADHLRASAFLLADGVMPSNEGRGYVLRRIMRRGMRHAHLLGADEPLMFRLVTTLVAQMGEAYPELKRAESMITETLKNEETRFKKTLEQGLRMLDEESAKVPSGKRFPGDTAFKLYDTFGFPVDLTQDALRSKGIEVDMGGFDAAMERQRAQARAAWAGSGDTATEQLWFDLLERYDATEFLGYASEEAEAQVLAIVKDGALIETAQAGDEIIFVTNQTPFYAESGGQVGDKGIALIGGDEAEIRITDTQKKVGKLHAHSGKVEFGSVKIADSIQLILDRAMRKDIRAHHSVTHLLHEALRRVLGDHVMQKGSLQNATRTRFDISHNDPIGPSEIRQIEDMVNKQIRADTSVETRLMPLEEAIDSGAKAMFGEKYDEEVRVLAMGTEDPQTGHPFSVELCGGTHVKRTGEIGLFKIVGQSAVSAGVRRVEGVAGAAAMDYLNQTESQLQETASLLKAKPSDVVERVTALQADKKRLENEIASLRKQLATGGGGESSNDDVREIGGVKFIAKVLPGIPAKDLKGMADELKKKIGSGVVALIATDESKASIVVGVTDDLTDRISAVDLVKAGSEALGGKGGGGRPDMAQAGGPNADSANDAVGAIEKALA